ncbi:MAG TPA: MFS transporter [Candidatus Fraserbacteria bacterium]|nr:MFS transporter [Candidatus Fraserbacteria bacterium]
MDGRLLFATRVVRLFAYGFLSVVLVLYLIKVGLSEVQVGLLLTLTLVGDAAVSLWITTTADRLGRQRMLLLGAGLMFLAGVAFVLTGDFLLLTLAAIIGVISPSGYEVGPFLSIEQAALSQIISDKQRTRIFAWYNLVGSFATALGALCGGALAQALEGLGNTPLASYRAVVIGYAALGLVLGLFFSRLSPAVEAGAIRERQPRRGSATVPTHRFGLHRSRRVVLRLSALFALDAFGGGLVIQSIVAYWFHIRFGVEPALLGGIFFGANILAGISALAAAKIADRIGLINTMVFTHIPSNLLLMLVPLMPSLPLAITVLLMRFSISQMDVPTRQSYTMAVVSPDERSAAAGVTGIARSIGASLSPSLAGALLGTPLLLSVPFFLAGGLKIVYDLTLYRAFRSIRPPEEEGVART